MRPSARSRNMVSITAMQSCMGRNAFIFSLFINSGSIIIFGLYLNCYMRPIYCYFFIPAFLFAACVSNRTYKALQMEKSKSDSLYTWAMATLKASQGDNDRLTRQNAALKDSVNDMGLQLSAVNENNRVLHKQIEDLSAISSTQAESIRKSMDNIGAKDLYLQRLRTALSRRDSMNLAVLMELKAALGSFSDSVVGIKVAQGVVSVTVADSLLFGADSTSYAVTDKGKTVLVRLARVLRDQPDVGCRVEVYADSVGLPPDSVMNGWELDVRRAASMVRALQNQYHVGAARLVAAGRGEYGQTRIVFVPPTDQLSEVLEKR
jgi:chemotaxis protein MotB